MLCEERGLSWALKVKLCSLCGVAGEENRLGENNVPGKVNSEQRYQGGNILDCFLLNLDRGFLICEHIDNSMFLPGLLWGGGMLYGHGILFL